jgi:hypothetical protein
METMYYIGLEVHKKRIDYCVKTAMAVSTAGSSRLGSTIIFSRMRQQ